MARDLKLTLVKKFVFIVFVLNCTTVRYESKVTEKENQCPHWKIPIIQALFHALCSNSNLVYFQKDESMMCDVERYAKLPEKVLRNKTKKIGQLCHSDCWNCVERMYHNQVGKTELSKDRCFPVKNCAFFSSWCYSWEVGNDRCKLSVKESTRCLTQRFLSPYVTFWSTVPFESLKCSSA